MKDDKISINVRINGFRLPLNIIRKDEEMYRKAEKLVVLEIEKYQKLYSQRPNDEILTLVAFHIAMIVSKQEQHEDASPLAEKIQAFDDELKALLSKE